MKVEMKRHKVGKGFAGLSSLSGGPERVKVGFPAGEAESDIIQRAIWNEFGTRGGASGGGWGGPIPERPFMRNAIRSNAAAYAKGMREAFRSIVYGAAAGQSLAALKLSALRKLGVKAQGDIQAEITSLTAPANSAVTIERKGSDKPLIDSGEMRAAVTYKVEG